MPKVMNKFTAEQILGINAGIGFLFPKEIEEIGVDLTWDIVTNQNALKPIIKQINEMGQKINKEFYEENPEDPKGSMQIIKGKEEGCLEAEKALNEKIFTVELKPFNLEKIKAVEGITVTQIFQLHPILEK